MNTMQRKKSPIHFEVFLILALLLSGCGQGNRSHETATLQNKTPSPHVKNHGYFAEEDGFHFDYDYAIAYPENPDEHKYLRFDAKFLGQSQVPTPTPYNTSLDFEQVNTGVKTSIKMASDYASFIKLVPDHVYQVTIQFIGFINYDTDLMITDNHQLVFLGISDYYPGAGKAPYEASPIEITNSEILKDHYILNPNDCVAKYTNDELRFEATGAAVELHQGETGKLGEYGINLLIARDVEFPNPNPCYDFIFPGQSFIVYKDL